MFSCTSASVSTAILIFTKTNSGGTDHVWFYDMDADGFSLDDKRDPVKASDIPDSVRLGKLANLRPMRAMATPRTAPLPIPETAREIRDFRFQIPGFGLTAQPLTLDSNSPI
jgi:hypothetical protein